MNVLRKMYQEKAGWVTDAMFPGIVIAFHMIILGFVIVLSRYTVHHSMKCVILYDVFFLSLEFAQILCSPKHICFSLLETSKNMERILDV